MKVCNCNTINTQSIPNDRDLFAPAPTGDPQSRDHRPRELRRYRRRAPSVFSQKPPDDRARTAEDWRVRYHCHILSFAAGSSSSQQPPSAVNPRLSGRKHRQLAPFYTKALELAVRSSCPPSHWTTASAMLARLHKQQSSTPSMSRPRSTSSHT